MNNASLKWLVYRRDHHGNLDVVRLPLTNESGSRYCWNLSEAEADRVIEQVQEPHRKPHGQMYDKFSYPIGTLVAFLDAKGLRV